ncbi:glycosyltransferase family 2 protein [Anaerolineales bacterium HSG6]|nr:glycosyltransferase family 2 protein [Anaerolineales bacterium HSG6]MDM8531051.1 glycosyltransferase family 2 protein [Anaerolineales bacterium HSG25]
MDIKNQPLVYIIILTWNRREDTVACLESLSQVDYPKFQIILVDNASQDDTVAVIQAQFPQVKVILNLKNLGFAGGNNVGIQYALQHGAEYVLLLNNDTEVDIDLLTHLVEACHLEQSIKIAIPKIYYHSNPQRIWSAGAQWRYFPPRVTLIGLDQPDSDIYNQPCLVEYATGCAMLIHRTVFDTVGLLDDRFFMYHEDYEFCHRVQQGKIQIAYVPLAIVWHKIAQSTGENSPTRWYYLGQSTMLFYRKLYRYYQFPLFIFLFWVTLRELLKGRPMVIKPFIHGLKSGAMVFVSAT